MATRKTKHRQTMSDATMLTYGRQDAYFQLYEDNEPQLTVNDEIVIPATLEVGTELDYDPDHLLYDINIEKVRSREPVEFATQSVSLVKKGSFNSSFNKSFY